MKRILACLFIMAVLPLMTSSTRHASNYSGPFATTAFAGHTNANGYYCNGNPDANDVCTSCGAGLTSRPMADQAAKDSSLQDTSSIASQPDSTSDAGAAVLLLLVALMAWSRM